MNLNESCDLVEKEEIINKNLKIVTFKSFITENKIFLRVDYMDGKFTSKLGFLDDYLGREELEEAKKDFNTEDKVKKYFNL